MTGLLWALAVSLGAQDTFPSTPPAAARLAPVRFPPFQEVTLPNGMTLLVVANHEQPIISVNLSFRAGAIYDPSGKEGTAELVAQLLTKGTPTRTAEQIAAAIEGVGGTLGASSGDDFLTVSLDILSDHADLAFDLLGDVTRRATFPTDELELARTQALSALALALSQPENVAARFFAREVYGRHPYGRSTTTTSYGAISQSDVKRFAATRVRPSGALLVITGDVTLARAQALARKAFGGWTGVPAVVAAAPAPPARSGTDILLVHRPGSVQGNVVLGNTTFLPTDPGYYAARVATQVLGGGADARLFLILREQKSWTYGSYARLDRKRGIGDFEATFEGRTEVVDSALVEMLHQIDRMRTELVPDSELTNVKGFLVGSFPLTIETPQQVASVIANARLLGLGPDYVRLYRERLAAVSKLQLRTAAARTYHRRALTIVVVGDAEQLHDRLKAIAPVRLVDIDAKPITLADLHPTASAPTLDRAQIVSRSDSFQVVIQGRPLGAMVTRWAVSADSIVYTEQTQIGGGAVQQNTTVRFNPADLTVSQVDQTGMQAGQAAETHLTYADGRVKGRSVAPQQSGTPKTTDIDTALVAGTYDDNALNTIIAALPLAPGQTFNVSIFESGQNRTTVMQIKVADGGAVTVPAGTFQTFRLDIAGGQVPIVMSVAKDTPRRIVKIELVGAPFQFELVK
ncbi:MAG TPA: pitrilysin family protein [Gemmatimonadales bacterium]|nr:pitrilysin family protein [Gemmatimonadales bacterium]